MVLHESSARSSKVVINGKWQQQPVHSCLYVDITEPRQMVPIWLRVHRGRKGSVVICSHPVTVHEIKRPNPSHTERHLEAETKLFLRNISLLTESQ